MVVLNREDDVVQLLNSFLLLHDYKPILCRNIGDALPIIEKKSNPIDLLIIDCNIGELSCLSAIKTVKASHPAKVILTVLYKDEDFVNQASRVGVDAVLTLPCSLKEFYYCLDMLI